MVVYFGFRPETGCAKKTGGSKLWYGTHRREVLPASGLDHAPSTLLISATKALAR